jgi:hypothetical protein
MVLGILMMGGLMMRSLRVLMMLSRHFRIKYEIDFVSYLIANQLWVNWKCKSQWRQCIPGCRGYRLWNLWHLPHLRRLQCCRINLRSKWLGRYLLWLAPSYLWSKCRLFTSFNKWWSNGNYGSWLVRFTWKKPGHFIYGSILKLVNQLRKWLMECNIWPYWYVWRWSYCNYWHKLNCFQSNSDTWNW